MYYVNVFWEMLSPNLYFGARKSATYFIISVRMWQCAVKFLAEFCQVKELTSTSVAWNRKLSHLIGAFDH